MNHLMEVLGIKLGSSSRAASDVNHQTIPSFSVPGLGQCPADGTQYSAWCGVQDSRFRPRKGECLSMYLSTQGICFILQFSCNINNLSSFSPLSPGEMGEETSILGSLGSRCVQGQQWGGWDVS